MLRFEMRVPKIERWQSSIIIAIAFVLFVAVQKFSSALLYERFPDTDDALRIVLVRQLLSGQPWFENIIPRALPPNGLDIHWSRLIDGGIAGLILSLRPFMSLADAESVARFTWPILWLLPTVVSAIVLARRLGGAAAVLACLFLLLFNPFSLMQFSPGRIDHHNVQIALTIIAATCLVCSDRRPRAAFGAGLAGGATLGIGFEALPFAFLNAAAMGAWWIVDPTRQRQLRLYILAMCVSAGVMHLVQNAPSRWFVTACDELGWNTTAAVLIGSIGVLSATCSARLSRPHSRAWRVLALLSVAGLAVGCFTILRPSCLRGPFSDVDPLVKRLLLNQAIEQKSFWAVILEAEWWLLAVYWPPILGLILLVVNLRASVRCLSPEWLIITTFAAVAIVLSMLHIRMLHYALWFVIPAMAGIAAQWTLVRAKLSFPSVFVAFVMSSVPATLVASIVEDRRGQSKTCDPHADVRVLTKLDAGLILSHPNIGPTILANTPHSIVVAPYHQMREGFAAWHEISQGNPDVAWQRIQKLGIDYIVMCPTSSTVPDNNLAALLEKGKLPDWLSLVHGDGPIQVYKVRSTSGDNLILQ